MSFSISLLVYFKFWIPFTFRIKSRWSSALQAIRLFFTCFVEQKTNASRQRCPATRQSTTHFRRFRSKDLRKKVDGTDAFDFMERSLVNICFQVVQRVLHWISQSFVFLPAIVGGFAREFLPIEKKTRNSQLVSFQSRTCLITFDNCCVHVVAQSGKCFGQRRLNSSSQ